MVDVSNSFFLFLRCDLTTQVVMYALSRSLSKALISKVTDSLINRFFFPMQRESLLLMAVKTASSIFFNFFFMPPNPISLVVLFFHFFEFYFSGLYSSRLQSLPVSFV